MTTHASNPFEPVPFGPAAGWRGVLIVTGAALLLAACGKAPDTNPRTAATRAKPATTAAARHAPSSAPAKVAGQTPPVATDAQQAQQQAAAAAKARLQAMGVGDLLTAARNAYVQHRVVAPAGDNAIEYYEAVLAKAPKNQVAKDALREIFQFGVPDVEQAISQGNFDEASREIGLLAGADSTNYTLTLLRSKLDAQKRLVARQQQQAQLQAQQAAALAAAQQAAEAKAAADRKAAEQLAAQQAAAAKAAPPPAPVAPPPPPPKPVGVTRVAKVLAPVVPVYPAQAARDQTSGYAVVEFTVAADGSVEDPHVVDSAPRRIFDHAAVQAVARSKFEPAMKDGEPIASTVRRRIDFKFGG